MILAGVISHVMMNIHHAIPIRKSTPKSNVTFSRSQYPLFTGLLINGYCIRNYISSNYSFLYRKLHQMVSSITSTQLEGIETEEEKGNLKISFGYVRPVRVCLFFSREKNSVHRVEPKTLPHRGSRIIFFESFVRISTTRMKWPDGTSSWLITDPFPPPSYARIL